MSACLSPRCPGDVLAQSLTDGHCDACGLHHRRRKDALNWQQIVGPVVVTLLGAAGGASTAADFEELIDADTVRFTDRLAIDVTSGTTLFAMTTRLACIVARDCREAALDE
jgi:hypothetical protein